MKAANALVKKKIFCISNLSSDTSDEELKSWIEQNDIKVLSIFDAKTKYKDSHAFRVCISEEDTVKFTSGNIWASNVIVREWIFKNKVANNAPSH